MENVITNFQHDQNELLDSFLNMSFVEMKNTPFNEGRMFKVLEIIVTPECNQKCEYCYLNKYGHESYPMDIRADKETTLHNIKMLMDYLTYEKRYYFREYELFAGDLFTTGYFFDLMDLLYPYFEFIYNKAPELFNREKGFSGLLITIPNNLRFIEDDNITQQVLEVYNKYKKIGTLINFSWSHDGKYSCDQREGFQLSDEYYDKAFRFLEETGSGIHPMMSPEGAKYAIENHKWWQEMYKKYLPTRLKLNEYHAFHLEVRNDGWTDEAISNYLKYLKFRMTEYFKLCNNEIDKVAYTLFKGDGDMPGSLRRPDGDIDAFNVVVNPVYIGYNRTTCMLQNSLIIRASDLAIVPCHRLAYHQFIGGWYETDEENTKIIGVKANNPGQLINLKTFRTDLAPVCVTCWNKNNCLKGCLGSQFEWSGEVYLPVLSVCKFQKAKTSFVLKMLCETGVLGSALDQDIIPEEQKEHLINLCERLGYKI